MNDIIRGTIGDLWKEKQDKAKAQALEVATANSKVDDLRRDRDEARKSRDYWIKRRDELSRELAKVNALLNEFYKAANWVLNVVNGVGKAGGKPEHFEYMESMEALNAARTKQKGGK